MILRACAYDRHDRYESAEEFRMALEQVRYPGQPELSDIRKPEIISDSPETDRNFTEEEKPEETVVLRNTDKRTGRRISVLHSIEGNLQRKSRNLSHLLRLLSLW